MAAGCGSWCHRVAEGLLYPCRLFLEPLRPALGFFTGSPEPFLSPFHSALRWLQCRSVEGRCWESEVLCCRCSPVRALDEVIS